MTFDSLHLAQPVLDAVKHEGYTTPTPIQAEAIPPILAGKDVLGIAQTGTGKTAAFALPLLSRLLKHHANPTKAIRILVLSPTRELAVQVAESFQTYGGKNIRRVCTIFGGVGQGGQERALSGKPEIVIATPGRFLDLLSQNLIDLRSVDTFVLDEADRMLDMGFINDVRKICARLPKERQTLLFSATMPNEIASLTKSLMHNPVRVEVTPESTTVERIDQCVYMVPKANKPHLLAHLLKTGSVFRAIVFTKTKHGADRVVRQLHVQGLRSEAIHGNKSQNARQRALGNFRAGKIPVLVATDIAARGIDVDDITHVFNYDIPGEAETYVHRIGRTARAGANGHAVAFCDPDERTFLRDIERLIRMKINVVTDQPEYPVGGSRDDDGRSEGRDRHSRGGQSRGDSRGGQSRGGPPRDRNAHQSRSHDSRSARPHEARSSDNRSNDSRSHEPRAHESRSNVPARPPLKPHISAARPHAPAKPHQPVQQHAPKYPAGPRPHHPASGKAKGHRKGQPRPGR